MKKQILAVAVAGAFAVPAFAAADSSVTLFGQLQTQIVHHTSSSDEFDSGIRSHDAGGAGWITDGNGPNRLGVMVNHDLGNGMTALLKIEQDAQTSRGLNSGARDQFVGLDGNFGRLTLGRQNLPYATAGKDPLNGTFMQARGNGARLGTGGDVGGLGNGSYLDRVVKYSNSFGMVGLQVAAAMDNGAEGNSENSEYALSGRLNFDLGAVDLYVAHTNADDFREAGRGGDFQATKIGADWKSGPFRLVGEIEDYEMEDGTGATVRDATGGFISGTYTMGRNDFVLNLGHTRNDGSNNNVDYAALGVKHNFSNRVMAFAGVSYTSFDDDATFGRPNTTVPGAEPGTTIPVVTVGGESFTAVGAGMRVSF
ncbi:porin [Thioalkalivibrio sp. ALMg11]|uniref:porin n=1 Tax=Thioalkalivibrio sp. ALMg11 TaxID=1158165 RepID=UPI000362E470|nr:porin [Thioalkalivibrio sp. ALMg11]